jgi:hypothetical protein
MSLEDSEILETVDEVAWEVYPEILLKGCLLMLLYRNIKDL